MDDTPAFDVEVPNLEAPLSYDDTTPYSEQVEPIAEGAEVSNAKGTLADRIGSNKVYLISDAALAARVGKRKHEVADLDNAEEDMDEDLLDTTIRDNALLFRGTPISHLPTTSIFAYATHFDAHPIALEWIDDTTCILVFPSRSAARTAYRNLTKSPTEDPSPEGFITAKPVPVELWPAEDRINKSLGKSEGLKGVIQTRWATVSDVKSKGSWETSEFYKKYGRQAGKPEEGEEHTRKRRKAMEDGDKWEKGNLDEELDSIQAEYSSRTALPRTRRRVDKSLLERTSLLRAHPSSVPLEARITAPLPRRARDSDDRGGKPSLRDRLGEASASQRPARTDNRRSNKLPRRTQEELDAELDEFLNSRD
ncbi:hypothetical protein QCA50_001263 [Cerrena zonata]|uniref:Chromatin target of PRMT1 protein C-terminal domain-containing protein n=1 Tax=Cerrena zonata TaxID=2478898 RepID=A0AAW0GYV8_9APHY